MKNIPKKTVWTKTAHVGVRYREHPNRKHNNCPDRYFVIRYQKKVKENGKEKVKEIVEPTGWASHGMNAVKANLLRGQILQNIREGKQPQSLAEKREMEYQRQEAELKAVEQKKKNEFLFDEAATAFLEWAKQNKKSWADDQGRYDNHVKRVIGKIQMKQVSVIHLERIKSNMKRKKLANKTIHHTLTLIRSIYLKSISWGMYAGPVPTKQIKLPSLDNKRTRFFSYEEAKQLLAELKKVSLTVYHQALLSLNCGLRFSEIARLQWLDVNLENGIIYIRDAKGGKSREAYITKPVEEIFIFLNDIYKFKNTDLIFPGRSGKPQQHISTSFYQIIKDMGFNDNLVDKRQRACFHTCRHTFASWLAIQGTSLFEIKELMGHSDIKMTERYSHLSPSVKKDAVNRMAATFDQIRIDESDKKTAKRGGDRRRPKRKKVVSMKR